MLEGYYETMIDIYGYNVENIASNKEFEQYYSSEFAFINDGMEDLETVTEEKQRVKTIV